MIIDVGFLLVEVADIVASGRPIIILVSEPNRIYKFPMLTPSSGALNTGCKKNYESRPVSLLFLETTR